MVVESWRYHPMGLIILALFALTAAQSLTPKSFRKRLARSMQTRANALHALYLGFVATFVGFGAIRALIHCAGGWMHSGF